MPDDTAGTPSTFGARLKRLRIKREMTQKMLGLRVGVDCSHICRYERDWSIPSVTMGVKLADALGVSIDKLLRGKPRSKR